MGGRSEDAERGSKGHAWEETRNARGDASEIEGQRRVQKRWTKQEDDKSRNRTKQTRDRNIAWASRDDAR